MIASLSHPLVRDPLHSSRRESQIEGSAINERNPCRLSNHDEGNLFAKTVAGQNKSSQKNDRSSLVERPKPLKRKHVSQSEANKKLKTIDEKITHSLSIDGFHSNDFDLESAVLQDHDPSCVLENWKREYQNLSACTAALNKKGRGSGRTGRINSKLKDIAIRSLELRDLSDKKTVDAFIQSIAASCECSKLKPKVHLHGAALANDGLVKGVAIVANQTIFKKHYTGLNHPESQVRVEEVQGALEAAKDLMSPKNTILPRPAKHEEILFCHSERYIQEVASQAEELQDGGSSPNPESCVTYQKPQWILPEVTGDFEISPGTLEASFYAAGAPLTAIEHILDDTNDISRAFCIVRPPGHHAHEELGSGFCVFNNVAIAAKFLSQKGLKVLIVDWDAHHGDGTQSITQNDQNIFYFSTHQDTQNNNFYPGSQWGHADDWGGCEHRTVLNCPVDGSQRACRKQILNAFTQQLVPAMDKFKPDFILISCGFDAHEKDPLVGLGLKNKDYGTLTEICVRIAEKYAKGRVVSVLEGGYNLKGVAKAIQAHVRALGVAK